MDVPNELTTAATDARRAALRLAAIQEAIAAVVLDGGSTEGPHVRALARRASEELWRTARALWELPFPITIPERY